MSERLLGLLGLGYRGRSVVVGVEAVRRMLQGKRCWCVVMAKDASVRAIEKVHRLAEAVGVPVVAGPSATILGARLGKPPVMVVGVLDRALAAGVVAVGGTFEKVRGQ